MTIFPKRFGLTSGNLVDSDFPDSARKGLNYLLEDLLNKDYLISWRSVDLELDRLLRSSSDEGVDEKLVALSWQQVYIFCERLYSKLLKSSYAQAYFVNELNQLLEEEGIAYEFRDGHFYRPGSHHTQKVLSAGQKVLGLAELSEARVHFSKARKFFSRVPDADYPNTVKEAVAALEAAVKHLFPDAASKDFNTVLRRLEGTEEGKIPPTIIRGMQALYAFRGAATGVSHGGADGGVVSPQIAELVLNLVASYIVFLVGTRDQTDEIPF